MVSKRTEWQKTGTLYHLKVAPWEGLERDNPVTAQDYAVFNAGLPIRVGVHEGALQIPWVDEVRPVQ